MGKVLHASYSGYFPFCIGRDGNFGPDEGETEGGVYPVGMSLEDAMKIYWRVRTWEISYEGRTADITPKYNFSDVGYAQISEEKEIVCSRAILFEDSAADYSFVMDIYANPPSGGPYVIKTDGELYWFRMEIYSFCTTDPIVLKEGGTIDVVSGLTIQDSQLQFLTYNISLRRDPANDPISITLSPKTYWSVS